MQYFFLFVGTFGADKECRDLHGRSIDPGLHYVPGPDTCTLCICDNGLPKWCKAVLCSPPQVILKLFEISFIFHFLVIFI